MNKINFKSIAALALCILMLALAGCGSEGSGNTSNNGSDDTPSGAEATPATDSTISAAEATGEFSIVTEDGNYTQDGSTYTLTSAGTYILKGKLDGQVLVSAGKDDLVMIELSGVTINNSSDSPIRILSADKVEISAKKDTDNVINDTRSAKVADTTAQGQGAISSKADLKIKGTGTLVVNAGYNNGVHTTKDLTIQKLTMKVTAVNNALKGNDSIKIKDGNVVAISTNGDGLKTTDTEANKSGVVRGDILISGGSIAIYAAGDGIQAAHDFEICADEEGNTAAVSIYTGSYSGYTADNAQTTSYKGVKAQNEITIRAGSISIASFDDGLHANYGAAFEAGGLGTGNINIYGGYVTTAVFAPQGKTGGGHMGPGGWGGQKRVSGADGIHADGRLTISGGELYIDSAYEGLEANVIDISGGSTIIAASDDGMNACKGPAIPLISISGGYVDVSVSANGDVDGIDSNGTYTQTGGVVITRGPNKEMAAAIDAEKGTSITGGTLIVLGSGRVQAGDGIKTTEPQLNSAGEHRITVGGTEYSFTNSSSYFKTTCYSDTEVSGS